MSAYVKLRVYLILLLPILFITSYSMSQSNTSVIDEIRDSITDENCQKSCFLGIQPNVMTEDELITWLKSNEYIYQYDLDDLGNSRYYILWLESDGVPFDYMNPEQPTIITTRDNMVTRVSIHPQNLDMDETLRIFTELPDSVGRISRLYAEQRVRVTIDEDNPDSTTVFSIDLLDDIGVEYGLFNDLRPCEEPSVICKTPLKPPKLFPVSPTTNATPTLWWSDENGSYQYLVSIESLEMQLNDRSYGYMVCHQRHVCLQKHIITQSLPVGTYEVKVRGENTQATSDWSNAITVTILSPPLPSAIAYPSAENPIIAEILDSITDENCFNYCFLGIEPGITTEDELITILRTSSYSFSTDYFLEHEDLTYLIDWSEATSTPFHYLSMRPTIVTTNDDVVASIWFQPDNISMDDALQLFPFPPDIVGFFNTYYRFYSEEAVYVDTSQGYNNNYDMISQIRLIDSDRVNWLLEYEDIRPCEEPVALCNTPLKPPTVLSISDTTNSTPTITWSAENGIESYLVSVSSTSTAVQERFIVVDVCNSSECSGALSQPLPVGTYDVKVRGENSQTVSDWSNIESFNVLKP